MREGYVSLEAVLSAAAEYDAQQDRPRVSVSEWIRGRLQEAASSALCQDEGCPHHGTDHVCLEKPPLRGELYVGGHPRLFDPSYGQNQRAMLQERLLRHYGLGRWNEAPIEGKPHHVAYSYHPDGGQRFPPAASQEKKQG